MEQLTPEMMETAMTLLGLSLMLNIALLALLLSRPLYDLFLKAARAYWIGFQILRQDK